MANCPFCGFYPYECVDVGFGCNYPVAVNCCSFGPALFDDRTPDHHNYKAAKRVLDALGEIPFGEERMGRAWMLFMGEEEYESWTTL